MGKSANGLHSALKDCCRLIEIATPPNPHTLKRVLNVLTLPLRLDNDDAHPKRTELLTKIALMQVLLDDAWRRDAKDHGWLLQLEKAAEREQTPMCLLRC